MGFILGFILMRVTMVVLMLVVMVVLMLVVMHVLADVVVVTLVMLVFVFIVLVAGGHGDARVNGGYAILLDLADREVKPQSQPFQFGDHGFLVDSEVEQQPEEHIAGYAGEGVQVQYSPVRALHMHVSLSTPCDASRHGCDVPFIVVDTLGRVHKSVFT
jgi:hypothetical protein